MKQSGLLKTLAAAVFLLSPGIALSQSYDAQNFKPTTDNGPYLAVEGSQTLGRNKWTLGLVLDYAQEPVIQVNVANVKLQNVIGRELAAHVSAAYGILPWLNVGVLASAAPYMTFQAIGTAVTQTRLRMGDTKLNFKFRILDNEKFPVGLAAVPFVTFPTGSGASFVGNGVFTGGANLVLESKRVKDRFSTSLNVGYQLREGIQLVSGTRADDLILYGVAANFAVHPKVDTVVEVRGSTLAGDLFGVQHRPLEFEGAVRYFPIDHLAITVGGGAGVLEGVGNPLFRALAGVAWVPEHKRFTPAEREERRRDSDGDGIRDRDDLCPSEAGPKETKGCPTGKKVTISADEYRILTQMIHFDFEKASLQPSAIPILETLASTLKAKPTIHKISVQGHTDFIGTVAFNNWLSQARAETVKKFLVDHGVEDERLETVGFGKSRPINEARTAAARAENRRVEFVLTNAEGVEIPSEVPQTPHPTLPETRPETINN